MTAGQTCVVCGGAVNKVMLEGVVDFEYGADWTGTIATCEVCGLGQQAPMLTVDQALSYYPKEYVHYAPKVGGLRTFLMRLYLKPIIRMLRRCGAVPGMRLLDIGCGGGLKAFILQEELGLEVVGVEPNAHAADHARSAFGLTVHTGVMPHPDLEKEAYDFILISHVIEHLPDPVGFLNDLHGYLRPDGYLIGETESVDCVSFKVFGKFWSFLHAPYHLLFFTKPSLGRAFLESLFKGVKLHTATDPMAWSLSIQNYFRREGKPSDYSSARMPGYLALSIACVPLSWIEAGQGPVLRFMAQKT